MDVRCEEWEEEVLIRFRLLGGEAKALKVWAAEELRRPVDQVRYVLRREMEVRGLMEASEAGGGYYELAADVGGD